MFLFTQRKALDQDKYMGLLSYVSLNRMLTHCIYFLIPCVMLYQDKGKQSYLPSSTILQASNMLLCNMTGYQ